MSQPSPDEDTPLITKQEDSSIARDMVFWTIGALYGASAVGLGAFGAHGLKKRIADPSRLANWNTAAQYQVRRAGPSSDL